MRGLVWVLGGVVLASSCCAQQQAAPQTASNGPAVVSFEFDRIGLPVPHFVLSIREDGSGSYKADEVERRSADSALQQVSRKHIERGLTVSSAMVDKVFKAARMLNRFNMDCASKAKNIADTGKKTLSYSGADGSGSCTYNYSEDKNVSMLGDTFFAIANTMDIGRKLEFERRFDRLGLDAELISLEHELQDKNALEVGSISAILNVIASDGELMQRARLRASKLLQQAADAK